MKRLLHPRNTQDSGTPSGRHRLGLATAASGGVALLGSIVAKLGADEDWSMDRRIREVLQRQARTRTGAVLRSAGAAGSVGVYGPATAITVAMVARRRGLEHAAPLIAAVGGAAGAAWLLKRLVRRPRPPADKHFNHPSFPSGHTTRASAAALAIAYTLVRERVAAREVVMPMAVGVSLLTGVGRAYADAHWTTDVIGGWALGTAFAASTALWYERVRNR